MNHQQMTHAFTSYGDKLLQHCDRLNEIQNDRTFRPIMIELCPTEACESHCTFCSVEYRPMTSMPFDLAKKCLRDFAYLGAKSLELTGGGNPLLYKPINELIAYAHDLGLKVGIITNSHELSRLRPEVHDMIDWLRISLSKLDQGNSPEDYDLCGFPEDRLGFSYIIHQVTNSQTLENVASMMDRFPKAKFIRIAGNCLIPGDNQRVQQTYAKTFSRKVFVKQAETDDPFDGGCYIGMVRPYVAPAPDGSGYYAYACNSHVLQKRTYDLDFALCRIEDILEAWPRMNRRFREEGFPYEVRGNRGRNWGTTCSKCYFGAPNNILHSCASRLPDASFA